MHSKYAFQIRIGARDQALQLSTNKQKETNLMDFHGTRLTKAGTQSFLFAPKTGKCRSIQTPFCLL